MDSITKNGVSDSTVTEMTRRAFDAKPLKIEEIREGFFNAVYKLHLDSGGTVVLKIAPSDSAAVMRYEKDIMKAEVAALNRIADFKSLPAPHVLFYDISRELIDSEYLFIELMPGVSMSNVENELKLSEVSELFTQTGIYAHKINSVSNGFFGSPAIHQKQFETWGETFCSMIDEILLDAEDISVNLPYELDYIRKRIESDVPILDEVTKPSLVHKNLWVGNILVDTVNTEITGIIDFERAIYADPLMEPVCGLLDENKNFICSYNSGREFGRSQKLRMAVYKIYLGLAGIVECAFRHYPDESVGVFFKQKFENGVNEYRFIKGEDF